ncbi:helix-turn-helix domain-containing protein [Epilithonimonas sp. JDS]|uniref:helix-turn-helix domain-containing protein n=1 Tax=Epilithonimonas sp. JDS TaxID=2902797 RepID=UPI001E4DFD77|nr:helix-turn-helix domain-containing protein [Epilithonimonas sp. JDS]MCD9855164.1 helix-turn-helix domain-containing protein [Epilithonimonas sp. JDS]
MSHKGPDYIRIYTDLINTKHPDKIESCRSLLSKKYLSVLDIIKLNSKISGKKSKDSELFNQQHKSYNKSDIFEILDYQKKYGLNNSQLAMHFNLSRNTVAKWKKLFI